MVLERLKEYIDHRGISIAAIEKAAGMSNASLRKAIQSGNGIGTDKLEKILTLYPDLSAEWLLRGEGEMLRDKEESRLSTLCRELAGINERKKQLEEEIATAIR